MASKPSTAEEVAADLEGFFVGTHVADGSRGPFFTRIDQFVEKCAGAVRQASRGEKPPDNAVIVTIQGGIEVLVSVDANGVGVLHLWFGNPFPALEAAIPTPAMETDRRFGSLLESALDIYRRTVIATYALLLTEKARKALRAYAEIGPNDLDMVNRLRALQVSYGLAMARNARYNFEAIRSQLGFIGPEILRPLVVEELRHEAVNSAAT